MPQMDKHNGRQLQRMGARFCGPKCSHCCFVVSIWGIIMLLILGGLFHAKSTALIPDAKDNTAKGMEDTAKSCFFAALLYVLTAAISFWQMRLNNTESARVQAYN
eukprot:m.73521 g.73521  ORF g.73521 m.73521 type:complete len:105 (-) comp8032_c0_seq1:534-848(-)